MKRYIDDWLTRLLFYSDIQPVLIGAIGPLAIIAYYASVSSMGGSTLVIQPIKPDLNGYG
jgi:hypothetical protein